MTAHEIEFQPLGRRGRCLPGDSFLECARRLGISLLSVCGGAGTCRLCRVQIVSGAVSTPTSNEREVFSPEELKQGWRLACQAYPTGDCRLYVPPESLSAPQRTQVEGLEVDVAPDPPVRAYVLALTPPSLADPRADDRRLLTALRQQHGLSCRAIDFEVLRQVSSPLREWRWRCRAVVRGDEVIAIAPEAGRNLGLAVDLGTTKVAGYLVDLSNGQTLASKGIINPQVSYGEDVISRISRATDSPAEAKRLQEAAVDAINQLAEELTAGKSAKTTEVVEAVIVGNTAMHHLLLGLPVRQLALSPYVPGVSQALDIKARDIGLKIAPGAYVHLLPVVAGFVGADHTAVLLAIGAGKIKGLTLALDIGTNTEVSLIDDGRIASVSCASGPAFEGGHIRDGMRAASGAIERLQITGDAVHYQTIDGAPPLGVCGSGILDALAQLYLTGIVDQAGRMSGEHPRLRGEGRRREFILVSEAEREGRPAIAVTQQDIRELQLAKAAIRTGIQTLLETLERTEEDIHEVIIAGAFGSYIDIGSAVTIGMLPSLPLERFRQVGNAAGTGARMALISRARREEAQDLAARTRYIELATSPNFMSNFLEAGYLGVYRLRQGKREETDADEGV